MSSPTPYPTSVLVSMPTSEHPAPDRIWMLEHELALRAELDPKWAARPLALSQYRGRAALILEDKPGEPLEQLLNKPPVSAALSMRRSTEPAMELGLFLRLAVGLAGALGEVHRRGIIHKDVKPAHILVNPATGQVWLTGFGIASRLPRERHTPDPPETIAGTLAYMAPEQTGRMNRSVDGRSDLYALGVTLYQMLTGSLPFTAAEPIEWVHCHIARQPMAPGERVANVPAPVSAIIMKLLAKTAEERYQTAAGLGRDLERCLAQWEAERRIDDFPLGEHDTPDRLVIPEKLYGRAGEVETLLAAFDRVVQGGLPELVLVSGYSGIGKSSVVNELHRVLVPPRALFAAGKFDQYKRDIPYVTLAQAFQSLIRALLAKSEVELGRWRNTLRDALGPNGQLMVDLVPELKVIIGEQPAVPELPPQDAQRRFQLVFRRFLGVFARPEHPLALFLDDLQWLDAATLDLLQDLLTQEDVRHVLLIGAYRDNEVTFAHPLTRRLEAIRSTGASVQEIALAPLGREEVCRFIADSLYCEPERATPLAELVHEMTAGNPFFTIQFLSALVEEGLVTFDHAGTRWRWDLTRVRAKGYTDNVIDLMAGKLSRLSISTQKALQQLASLGNSAGFAMLARVYEDSKEELDRDLQHALLAGLVFRSEGVYRFLHDRVQEAAYSLIPEAQRAEAHLRIGRLLLAHTPPGEREDAIFEMVNQLNRGAALISSREEREQLAELNLIAGQRAKGSAAFASALTYLASGAALLAEDCWERRHGLAFALELNRAECEYSTGQPGPAEERLSALATHAAALVERAAIACLRMDLYLTQDQAHRAIGVGLDFLRDVGVEWPPHPSEEEVRREYDRVWSQLGTRAIEDLIELPVMTDPSSFATLDILAKLAVPALATDNNLHGLVSCRAVNLSLERGNCDASCYAYVWLGAIAGAQFGDYQAGYRFGRVGYELAEQRGWKRHQPGIHLMFGSVIIPWARHVKAGRDLLHRAIEGGQSIGDVNFAVGSGPLLNANMLAAGDHLADVERVAQHHLELALKARYGLAIDAIAAQLGLVRTLRGLTWKFGCFDNEQFEEAAAERRFAGNPNLQHAESRYWICKLQAHFFAGDYAAAITSASRAQPLLWAAKVVFEAAEYHLYGALSRAACCDSGSCDGRQQHLEAMALHQRQLDIWAQNCPENFENRALLVGAEIARIEGRELDAECLYEAAIKSARDNEFVHNEALAHELAARFYAARGFETIARVYLRNARYGYLRWGADGKVRQLDQLYPYLKTEGAAALPAGTIGAPLEQLDLATVMKVSQAVSAEMVLEKLLDTLMQAAVEHAGAERAVLILSRDAEPRIVAEATTNIDKIVVQLLDQPAAASLLPETILRYVLHTHERVSLDDAAVENPFSTDPYIGQQHARSVLCVPLLKQTRLVGVIYLENNLTAGAFTPPRMALLEVLASDAAISLENALLYQDLQERERETRMIVDSIPGLVATLTPTGEVEAVNEQVLAYCGRTLEELKQWGTSGTVHADDLPRVIEIISNSMKSGYPYEIVERIRRFDGVYRWFQVRGLPLRDSNGSIVRWYVLLDDIDDLKRAEALLDGEKWLLEMVASGCRLEDVLEAMCGLVDTMVGNSACSILLIDPQGTFRHAAGPTLPPGYDATVNGAPVACEAGPCGTAASLKKQVIASDLVSEQRWAGLGWRTLVLAHGFRSVCSTPIVSLTGTVLGTFAIYRREPGTPSALLKDLIARFTHVASIAIERAVSESDQKRADAEIRALKDQLYKENLVLRDEVERTSMFEEIVGTSRALQPVLARVAKVAQTDSTVLITGETGTGKELVARAIHRLSPRSAQAFVSVNCAAVPRDLIASELFGHEKGAFTGATQRRLGRFELAHGGTIFLDEVGELTMETQVALLRVLQERELERVGGSTSIRVDVRVIAATNRDLQAAIETGTFRRDLFYRLNVFPIAVPALRERADDISLLVEYFIDRYARKAGKTIRRVNKRTLDHLRAYPWPGNVRELQNVIERSVILCDTDEFTVDESWLSARPTIEGPLALSGTLAAQEKAIIEDALQACGGRVFGPSGAAERLGIPRSTLESKIRALKVNKNRFRVRPAKS
ncbi:MAG TPA: sigma 54-interacting transcriptional regulator [Thermoanaerobaculia bacterium]|nr:sigma 54-interacting transcriptional regulator [Thermoanaerobaculia bacterium]